MRICRSRDDLSAGKTGVVEAGELLLSLSTRIVDHAPELIYSLISEGSLYPFSGSLSQSSTDAEATTRRWGIVRIPTPYDQFLPRRSDFADFTDVNASSVNALRSWFAGDDAAFEPEVFG